MNEINFAVPASWSYGFALFAFAAFALQLGLGWRGGARASMLLAAVVLSAVWAAAGLAYTRLGDSWLWMLCRMLDLLRTGALCAFVMLLLYGGRTATLRAAQRTPERSPAFAGALILAAMLALAAMLPSQPPGLPTLGSSAQRLGYIALLGVTIYGLVLLEQLFRNAPEASRWALKPLCLGLGGAFVYNLFMYVDAALFSQFDVVVWSAHAAVQALMVPFLALAAVRNKDWTIDIHMSRRVVFHSTALLASGLYLLAAAGVGYYVRFFGGTWGSTLQIALLSGAALLLASLVLSGTLRSRLRVYVNKNFFSYRYDYREEWLRFTKFLAAQDISSNLHERVIRALANLVESPGGALWTRDEQGRFRQAARWNMCAVVETEAADGELAKFLAARGWVINVEECRGDPARYTELKLPHWLASMSSAWLLVPLVVGEELSGYVVLATPRAKLELDWEVLDLLKTAAHQAASYLGQAQATEALLESRKFDAFNRMSAFVVHDLKNLIAQLNLLLKNAERHRDNPEFQADMLDTVKHVEARMNHLLLQLRAGATPIENRRAIDVGGVVCRVQRAKCNDAQRLSVNVAEGVAAFAHEDRLEHVIGHLVQNALDATEPNGHVAMRVYTDAEAAVIEVRDNGVGMTPEFVRDRLFRPFQTTKPTGMGIGAYESAQYLQAIGGRLVVESEVDRGTCMKVLLPRHMAAIPVPLGRAA
ncbi:MAG TPA: XrtA/PEP-CTERM system histidine kinase PrsK [Burkholderiales bacterium]